MLRPTRRAADCGPLREAAIDRLADAVEDNRGLRRFELIGLWAAASSALRA
jgi:hypothetical protein